MTSPLQTPFSMPELSSFYMKTGLLMAFEASLRKSTKLQYLRDFLITIDEPTAVIYPNEDMPNWPSFLVRLYKKRTNNTAEVNFQNIGFTPETVGVFNNEYLDFHGLKDLDTAMGTKFELVGHYLAVNEMGNLNLMPCRGETITSDPLEVLQSAPKELMDAFRVIRATEFYHRHAYKEGLETEELKAVGGLDTDYQNWLFANAVLAASLIGARQALEAQRQTEEDNRLRALQSVELAPGEATPVDLVPRKQLLDAGSGQMRDMTDAELLQWEAMNPSAPAELVLDPKELFVEQPETPAEREQRDDAAEQFAENLVDPERAVSPEDDERILRGLRGASANVDRMVEHVTGVEVKPSENIGFLKQD